MKNESISIEAKNLTKRFGKFTSVNDVSFNVYQGEIFGFLGATGAGKSTTIKMLCGILDPTSGDAFVGGYSIKTNPEMVKRKIGYMSQKFSLYDDLTIDENINFYGGVYRLNNSELRERKEWALRVADLLGKEKLLTKQLPGGIKQRLALAVAVLHRPKIIFLDEPTSGVDPISRRNFWDLINQLSVEGYTIFVTTHYLEEAEFCNNIILINRGIIIAEGDATTLKARHITNPLIEVEAYPIQACVELMKKASFIKDVSLFGTLIHATLVSEKYDEAKLYDYFSLSTEIQIKRIERIMPTLEDVFVTLMDEESK